MNRIRLCSLSLLILFYLSGCSKEIPELDGNANSENLSGKDNASAESGLYEINDLEMLTIGDTDQKYYLTENGYYYITEDTTPLKDDSPAHHLFYVDFETKQEVHLCNDSSCQHDTKTCTAVLPMDEFEIGSSMFVYQNNLYILSRPYDYDGSSSVMVVGDDRSIESQPAVLYRMELDGSNREIIYRFDPDVTVENSVLADEDGLYVVTKKLSSKQEGEVNFTTSSEREIIRIDTSTWQSQTVIDMDFDNKDTKWAIIGSRDDQLIVKGIIFETPLSLEEELDDDTFLQAYENSKTIIASVDLPTGDMKELETLSNKDLHSVTVDNGIIYLSIEGDDEIIRYNLTTEERDVLANIKQNYILDVLDGKLITISWEFVDDYGMNFVDMETGEVSKSNLVTKTLGWRLEIRGETKDHILVVYDYDAEARHDDSFEINRYKLALIKKSDLYQGIDNFEPIQMVGKGI